MNQGGRLVGLGMTNGLLTQISEATGSRTFAYDTDSHLTSTHWGLLSTSLNYGAHGRLFQVDQGSGSLYQLYPAAVQGLQTTAQTADQDIAMLVDPLGRQHTYKLDEAGRIEEYTGPGPSAGSPGQVESWERDSRYLVTSHTNALGTSTFSFDAKGNTITSNKAGVGAFAFTYDSKFNHLTSSTDPSNHQTQYQIDDQTGFVTQVQNAGGGLVLSVFASGLLQSSMGLNGATTTYQYDTHRRLTAEFGPLGRYRSRSYDSRGNLETVVDGIGAATNYVYDDRNRLVQQTDALGFTTSFAYDPSGLLIAQVDPNGKLTEYSYDQRGYQLSVTEGVGTLFARTTSAVYDGRWKSDRAV